MLKTVSAVCSHAPTCSNVCHWYQNPFPTLLPLHFQMHLINFIFKFTTSVFERILKNLKCRR